LIVIDWINLAANSLWILGCALALASFSYASWRASLVGGKLGDSLDSLGVRQALYLAGLFFCAGLAILTEALIGRGLWIILGLIFGAGLVFTRRGKPIPSEDVSETQ